MLSQLSDFGQNLCRSLITQNHAWDMLKLCMRYAWNIHEKNILCILMSDYSSIVHRKCIIQIMHVSNSIVYLMTSWCYKTIESMPVHIRYTLYLLKSTPSTFKLCMVETALVKRIFYKLCPFFFKEQFQTGTTYQVKIIK